MRKIHVIITLLSLLIFIACETAIDKNPKYQRPVWLEGKVFTVASSVSDISMFTECLARTGLDEILDKSGLYTLMAPTNTAFEAYLTANNYQSIDEIDSAELKRLVSIHILLNPWSKDQLRQLNTGGWIDTDDDDALYSGYKRETFLRPENKLYRVYEVAGNRPLISDNGNGKRIVYSAYNKYVPLFYSEYMNYSNVTSSDFEFYYERPFESSEIYVAGAQLLSTGVDLNDDGIVDESYAAENGYVYLIDRVIEPLKSADELLFQIEDNMQVYGKFGDLINEYALFTYNEQATLAQEGANEGLSVDKLYNISFSNLAFNIANENNSIAIHNAIFAPENDAINDFETNVLGKGNDYYGGFTQIPGVLKKLIVDNHMVANQAYYPSQAGPQGSLYNRAGDRVDLSDVNVLKKYYGSNSTFIGIDKMLMPDIFPSVAAPVILRPAYSSFFASMYVSGFFNVLSNLNTQYTLFAIPNVAMENDSSLFLTYTDDLITGLNITSSLAFNMETRAWSNIPARSTGTRSLRNLISGQIALGTHQGRCKKEFLRTLSGYYIGFNSETGFVWGGDTTRFGYMGDSAMVLNFNTELTEDFGSTYGLAPVNGKTYSVNHWMQFPQTTFSFSKLRNGSSQLFSQLIQKAGLLNSVTNRLTFLSEGDALTVFVPSDAALTAIGADTLATEALQTLLLTHFIKGATMFTDNVLRNPIPDSYFTAGNKLLKIGSSEADKIDIYARDGSISLQIEENENLTNIMYLGWDNGDNNDGNTLQTKQQVGISVVVHFIDNVIQPDIVF